MATAFGAGGEFSSANNRATIGSGAAAVTEPSGVLLSGIAIALLILADEFARPPTKRAAEAQIALSERHAIQSAALANRLAIISSRSRAPFPAAAALDAGCRSALPLRIAFWTRIYAWRPVEFVVVSGQL
jgi:hypothetical protein